MHTVARLRFLFILILAIFDPIFIESKSGFEQAKIQIDFCFSKSNFWTQIWTFYPSVFLSRDLDTLTLHKADYTVFENYFKKSHKTSTIEYSNRRF